MIKRKEMTTILINLILAKMVLMFPKMLTGNSANAAYLQALFNTACAFLLFFLVSFIYRGQKNVIELAYMSGGKALRIFVGLLVFVSLMMNYASVIRIFPETIKIVLLQDIRVDVITLVFEIAIGIGAYIGLRAIARINYMLMPIMGGVLVMFLVLLIPHYNYLNLMPVFGNGADKIFINGFNTLSMYSDLLLLNIFLPFYENMGEAKKSGRRAIMISAVFVIIIMLAVCLVFPYPTSDEFMIPLYQLTRMIHLSSFFSRFEAFFEFAWSLMLLTYSAVYIYALSFVWKETFGLKYSRPLIFPIVILSEVIALLPDSLPELIRNEKWENIIVYPVVFLLPFIFGFVSRKYFGKNRKDGKR